MKSVEFKNEHGELIEVKRGDKGQVLIRHSDVDAEIYGTFRDTRDVTAALSRHGFDVSDPQVRGMAKLAEMFIGPHLEFKRSRIILSENEVRLIRAAVTQLE